MTVTAIILTLNEERHLARCLASLDGVVDSVVLSYAVCWDPSSHPWRRSNGWVNDYHLADLLEMFGQVGGVFRRTEVWHGQYLMRVDLRRTTDGPVSEEHTG